MRRHPPLLILAALGLILVLTACGRDGENAAGNAPPAWTPNVLVMSDGGTELHVVTVLADSGMDTTRGGLWYEDPGPDLHRYDVVVLLNGEDFYHRMSEATQVRLAQYVADGGGLVVTEWFAYYAGRNRVLAEILPVAKSERFGDGTETLRPLEDHPLTAGLPAAITTGPDWSWITLVPDTAAAKQARVAVRGDAGGPSLVTGVWGGGRVAVWGMAGVYRGDDIWTGDVDRLMARVVAWAAGG